MMVKNPELGIFKGFKRSRTTSPIEEPTPGPSTSTDISRHTTSEEQNENESKMDVDDDQKPEAGPSNMMIEQVQNIQISTIPAPFSESMQRLKECQWYWGAISAKEATKLLENRPPGTFLVRDSRSENYIFSLSYKTETGVYHSRLARYNGRYCLGGPNALISSPSLVDFIEETIRSSTDKRILMHPSSENPRAEAVQVKFPLNRRQMLPSLKYLCRLVIRHSLRDPLEIQNFPVPKKIKKFLAASNYMLVC